MLLAILHLLLSPTLAHLCATCQAEALVATSAAKLGATVLLTVLTVLLTVLCSPRRSFGYLNKKGYCLSNGVCQKFPIVVGELGSYLKDCRNRCVTDNCMVDELTVGACLRSCTPPAHHSIGRDFSQSPCLGANMRSSNQQQELMCYCDATSLRVLAGIKV